jgi:hypothetical protein
MLIYRNGHALIAILTRRYCSAQCQQQHWLAGAAPWQQHKPACMQVKAARAAGALQ